MTLRPDRWRSISPRPLPVTWHFSASSSSSTENQRASSLIAKQSPPCSSGEGRAAAAWPPARPGGPPGVGAAIAGPARPEWGRRSPAAAEPGAPPTGRSASAVETIIRDRIGSTGTPEFTRREIAAKELRCTPRPRRMRASSCARRSLRAERRGIEGVAIVHDIAGATLGAQGGAKMRYWVYR